MNTPPIRGSGKTASTPLTQGNEALRQGSFAQAIAHYAQVIVQQPGLAKSISANLSLARQKYRTSRQANTKTRVAVCGWELAHNAAGRAYTLATIYETFAHVEIIGSLFPSFSREIWEPIRDTPIAKHTFVVEDESKFIEQAIQLVAAHPYDIVHLSKPRAPNIFFGILYKLFWDAKVLMDIDDEELAFVGEEMPISVDDYIKQHGKLPELQHLAGKDWTRLAVGLAKEFDGVTVCNAALQERYGGEIIRHARDEKLFKPSPELKRQSREKYGIAQDAKVVMFLGTPREHKGLIVTAQAIASLKRPDIIYCIVGSFPDQSLKDRLLHIADCKYLFYPNKNINELPNILSVADCCILFQDAGIISANYQSAAKLSDAFAMKVPVIGNDLIGRIFGLSCEQYANASISTISTTLCNILSDNGISDQLSEKAYQYFIQFMTIDATSKILLRLVSNHKNNKHSLLDVFAEKYINVPLGYASKAVGSSLNGTEANKPTSNYRCSSDVGFFKKFITEDEYNRTQIHEKWDTRLCSSITSLCTVEHLADRFYIVPAFNRPKNTTRYRAYNLAEQISIYSKSEIIDINNISKNFLEILRSERCVVILQRVAFQKGEIEGFLNDIRNTPAIIVYEIDDQIFDESELESWRIQGLLESPSAYLKVMQYADQFIVSTKELRRKIETAFNKPTHVIGNVLGNELAKLSFEIDRSTVNEKIKDEFVVGYGSGSSTHDADLAVALDALSLFLEKRTSARFYCIGDFCLPEWFKEKHFNQLIVSEKCDWRKLPQVLAKFDVQIIPLQSVKFNFYKSHIRFLESSAVGVPVIASYCGEQAQTIINGYTGILVSNKTSTWLDALEWAFDNKQALNVIGANARDYIKQYWMCSSKFRRKKLLDTLSDFSLGLLRDKISIIIVVYNPLRDVVALFDSIQKNILVPYELLIWVNTNDEKVIEYINSNFKDSAYVINLYRNVGKAFAANHLFRISTERFVGGLDDDYIVPRYWAENMISAVKAVPKIGWLSTNLSPDSSGIRGLGKSSSYPGGISLYLPSGVGGWVVFTSASAREYIGYYKEHGLYGGIDGDFNRRARALGLTTGYVRSVVGKHKTQRDCSLAWELFKQRIQDNMRTHGKDSDLVTDKFVDFFSERPKSLTCSIKISTSLSHNENVWGDTHFANGLKYSLEGLDYIVDVSKHEEWYSNKEKPDVVIHLFGLHEYEPEPYCLNILWIISHVDKLRSEQLIKYDYIFCASKKTLELVKGFAPEVKSEILHQCTDDKVFYPDTEIQRDIDVLFVGNSRRVYRDSVKFAIEAGVDLHIWGTKWDQFIPKRYIKGQSVSSHEVANLYRRAKVVLNDHWSDQNEFGLINNRIFDALACGASVLTDRNPGLEDVFGNIEIPTYIDQESFSEYINRLLLDQETRSDLVAPAQQYTLNNCRFSDRAKVIHAAVKYLIGSYVDYKSEYLYKIRTSLL